MVNFDISELQAIPILIANSSACLFSFGNVPGCANVMVLTCVLGSAPKAVESDVKILLLVNSCAWTSNPITVLYFFDKSIVDSPWSMVTAYYGLSTIDYELI